MAMQLLPFIHVLIFLSSFIKVSVASEFAVNFTTTPKDAEYFVGSEAILQWEYSSSPTGAVQHIKFGIQAPPQDKGSASQDVTIFVKDVLQSNVQFNTKTRRDITAPFNGRATVVETKRQVSESEILH
ncbi:hypothetical protein OS493_015203 [Desmophyllum pertusum]|uniref:Uncharacterized protein n=1 Tax=Desmophyllum pertusum TaxID=174260 RepID=A0A9X0D3X5_9CNID|nr:hypothetical protein OS493_015203 [Desmophyllum pertusum]